MLHAPPNALQTLTPARLPPLTLCWGRPPQNKQSEFCAPLTSFDWNEANPKQLGTCSIDTTCTIWDIEVGSCQQEQAVRVGGRGVGAF
eukprot:366486-Chlamydomonas_euryale.AAC.2